MAQRNDQVAAFFLLQKLCIDVGHLGAVHPLQVRVFAVAVGFVSDQAKQPHQMPAHPLDDIVFGPYMAVGSRTEWVCGQIFRADIRRGIADLVPFCIVFDEQIGDQQLRQAVVYPIAEGIVPGCRPGIGHRLVAYVKFVVAQGAKIHLHLCQRQDLPAFLVAVLVWGALGVIAAVQGQILSGGPAADLCLGCRHPRHAAGDMGDAVRTHLFGRPQIGVDIIAQQQHHIPLAGFRLFRCRQRPAVQHRGYHRARRQGSGRFQESIAGNLFHGTVLLFVLGRRTPTTRGTVLRNKKKTRYGPGPGCIASLTSHADSHCNSDRTTIANLVPKINNYEDNILTIRCLFVQIVQNDAMHTR